MTKRPFLKLTALAALALCLPAGFAQTAPFKIGFILPMTGQSASTGRQIEAAAMKKMRKALAEPA